MRRPARNRWPPGPASPPSETTSRCPTMSGCFACIVARHSFQSGSRRSSMRSEMGTIRRRSLAGSPMMFRSWRSVVMTSEVFVIRSSRNCSSRSLISARSATVSTIQIGLFQLEQLLGQRDRLLTRLKLRVLLGKAPVLLLDRADMGHHLGLEPPEVDVRLQPADDQRRRAVPLVIGELSLHGSPAQEAEPSQRIWAGPEQLDKTKNLRIVQTDADRLG